MKNNNFKNKNKNFNKNKNNNNNNNDNSDKNFDVPINEYSRGPAFYYDLLKNQQKFTELIRATERLNGNFSAIAKMESEMMNFEYNLKRTQKLHKTNLIKCNGDLEAKYLNNISWCTQPLQLVLDTRIFNEDIYKTSGIVVTPLEKLPFTMANFHDPFAVERRLLERDIIRTTNPIIVEKKIFRYKIGDMGCSTRLSYLYMPDMIVFNRPVLDAKDVKRKNDLECRLIEKYGEDWNNLIGYCNCKQGNTLCSHLDECDIINMTHSMYYISEDLVNNIVKSNKKITGVVHIFAPGDFVYDVYGGNDHFIHVDKKGNNVKFNVLNDKMYEHKTILNYLWDKNELSFKNCVISVKSRINHGKFQHINFVITPFKIEKPDVESNFVFFVNDAQADKKIELEGYNKIIQDKSHEINFTHVYNSGYLGYLKCYDAQGAILKDEEGKDKFILVRKIKNNFVFPKLINDDWLKFESKTKVEPKNDEFIFVKEELLNSCLRALQGDDFEKNFRSMVNKVLAGISCTNPDIMLVIIMNILNSHKQLQDNLAFIKKTEIYKYLKDKQFEKFVEDSWFHPINKLKDKFFNTQENQKIKLVDEDFKNKRVNNVKSNQHREELNKKIKFNNKNLKNKKQEKLEKIVESSSEEDTIDNNNSVYDVESEEEKEKEKILGGLDFEVEGEQVRRIIKNIELEKEKEKKKGANQMTIEELDQLLGKDLANKVKQYKLEDKNIAVVSKPERNLVLSNNKDLRLNKNYVNDMRNISKSFFSNPNLPLDIDFTEHSPEGIQKIKDFIAENMFPDPSNTLLKNYLSQYGITEREISVEEKYPTFEYSLDVDPDNCFTKEEVEKISKDFKQNRDKLFKYVKNNKDTLGKIKNTCLFHAIAEAIRNNEDKEGKIARLVFQDCIKAALNKGHYLDFINPKKRSLKYVKDWLATQDLGIMIFDEDKFDRGELDLIESYRDENYSFPSAWILLLKKGGHVNLIKKIKNEYGSLESELEYQRVLNRKCIDKSLYKEFITNLISTKDKFVCPLFPEMNGCTSYEEFCSRIPCTCKGPMCVAHTLNDLRRDNSVVFYSQCPRIQIIANLRQVLPQNQFNPKLEGEFDDFIEYLYRDRNIESLIEKHFSEINYSRWLQRCKPTYRNRILKLLKKTKDWYSISEPIYVKAMVKEEAQTDKDKARMIGCPEIEHKILIGPLESHFEEFFKEIFPDFWGVGESLNTKEYEINELIERLNATNAITLDISGLDQSHNSLVKKFWRRIVKDVCKFLKLENKSLFNPDNIYKALEKKNTIIISRNSEGKLICMTELNDKMASGQGYTTVINTSLMCFLLEFTRFKFDLNLGGKVSGDDCALVTSDEREKLSSAFGYVFSKKGANNVGGSGLVMKYFRYGSLDTLSPCSLMCAHCPNHGYRLVRNYDRYLMNFFYSQKMLDMPRELRKYFFDMVCIGEQFWSKGYKSFEKINERKVPSNKHLNELVKFFENKARIPLKIIKKNQKIAEEIFLERGYVINENFWTQEEYVFKRDFNFIRNENKRELHKIPVESCCSFALQFKLKMIDYELYELNEWNYMDGCDNLEAALSKLNYPVKYKLDVNEKYEIFDYKECQEKRKLGLGFTQHDWYGYDLVLESEFMFFRERMRRLMAKIRKYRIFSKCR